MRPLVRKGGRVLAVIGLVMVGAVTGAVASDVFPDVPDSSPFHTP